MSYSTSKITLSCIYIYYNMTLYLKLNSCNCKNKLMTLMHYLVVTLVANGSEVHCSGSEGQYMSATGVTTIFTVHVFQLSLKLSIP